MVLKEHPGMKCHLWSTLERSGWLPIHAQGVTETGPFRCLVTGFALRIVPLLGEEEVTG